MRRSFWVAQLHRLSPPQRARDDAERSNLGRRSRRCGETVSRSAAAGLRRPAITRRDDRADSGGGLSWEAALLPPSCRAVALDLPDHSVRESDGENRAVLGAVVTLSAVSTAFVVASSLRPAGVVSWLLTAYVVFVANAVIVTVALSPSRTLSQGSLAAAQGLLLAAGLVVWVRAGRPCPSFAATRRAFAEFAADPLTALFLGALAILVGYELSSPSQARRTTGTRSTTTWLGWPRGSSTTVTTGSRTHLTASSTRASPSPSRRFSSCSPRPRARGCSLCPSSWPNSRCSSRFMAAPGGSASVCVLLRAQLRCLRPSRWSCSRQSPRRTTWLPRRSPL